MLGSQEGGGGTYPWCPLGSVTYVTTSALQDCLEIVTFVGSDLLLLRYHSNNCEMRSNYGNKINDYNNAVCASY